MPLTHLQSWRRAKLRPRPCSRLIWFLLVLIVAVLFVGWVLWH
jgi:hypothetical protein